MSARLPFTLWWRLSVLWFLEWGITGTIMTYLPIYWEAIQLSKQEQGQLMAVTAIGLWVAPFIVGQVADRWMATEKYLCVSHFVGGVTLYGLAYAAELYEETHLNFQTLLALCGIFAVAYFPTVPLACSLCFRHLPDPDAQFGKVRVWGTVGWMLSGLALSVWLSHDQLLTWVGQRFLDLRDEAHEIREVFDWLPRPTQSDCFRMSALLSFALSSFCVFLPHTPPAQTAHDKVAPLAVLSLFGNRTFALFMTTSFLLAVLIVPLYSLAVPNLLHEVLHVPGNWVPTVMLVGQISEFPALLLLSMCLRRLGLKTTFALGIAAWSLRYALFSLGGSDHGGSAPLVLTGLALHGVCHVFLVIVAQLYIDSQTRKDLRASTQSLLAFVTLGIGMPLGALLGGVLHEQFAKNSTTLFAIPAGMALALLGVFWWTIRIPVAEAESGVSTQA